MPLSPKVNERENDDCMDAGGGATPGAVAEGEGQAARKRPASEQNDKENWLTFSFVACASWQ
jgi:hypothetical protein